MTERLFLDKIWLGVSFILKWLGGCVIFADFAVSIRQSYSVIRPFEVFKTGGFVYPGL